MERAKKGKFIKFQKKKLAPVTKLSEGINKKFLITVNDNLFKLPEMSEPIRDEYITRYSRIEINLRFLSPIYFASAIAFLHDYPEGPTDKNFTDSAVKKYVSRLMMETPSTISTSTLELRRKIEFLRYIRLLIKINDTLPEF
jgi:hypothetical protein